jgi:transcriptional regulator with XRE-family HTH domain
VISFVISSQLMSTGRTLRAARLRAGMTQRELARRANVSQPSVARIERDGVVPRVDTLQRLLGACGNRLAVVPMLGSGVDRSAIRALLRLTPAERARIAVAEAHNLERAIGRRSPRGSNR